MKLPVIMYQQHMRYMTSIKVSYYIKQSYNCPSASLLTLEDMDKTDWYFATTKHTKNLTVCKFLCNNWTYRRVDARKA